MDKTTGLPGIQILGHGMEGGRRGEEGMKDERREGERRAGGREGGKKEWRNGAMEKNGRGREVGLVERQGGGGGGQRCGGEAAEKGSE